MRISLTTTTTLTLLLPLTTLATTTPDIPLPIPEKPLIQEPNHLVRRQGAGVGAAGGPVAILPSPTQMSPITTYMVRGPNGDKTPMPYTQLFSKVPEQWPEPTAGVVGLGTIQGVVGVVKTKRSVETGVAEVRVVKRGDASVGVSGARRVEGPRAVVWGVGMVAMLAAALVGV